MSAADLMAVLMTRHLRYDWQQPDDPANDHLIFSKGHASPLLYSMFKAAGVVSDEELMTGYRRFGSRLEGHPTPVLPWVDVATGSLGQGLPDGVGVALAGRYLDELPYRVWVLCGDSEMAEGSMWEALDKASYYRLGNLTAIVDVNRLGQRGPTELGWDTDAYAKRVEAFGCRAIVIDGHDLGEIDKALAGAAEADRPTVILARTRKGRGFSEVEDREGWHGRPLPAEMAERAIIELGGERHLTVSGPRPEGGTPRAWPERRGDPAPLRAGRQGRHPAGLRPGAGRGRRPRTTSSPWTGRWATPRTWRSSPRRIPSATSRCSSPSSSSSRPRSACLSAGTSRSPPRSPRSSPAPTTSSGCRPSPRRTSGCAARTRASRSARTARPRWPWRTWP